MMKIIIENGRPPQFEGEWTVGQIIEIARALEQWALTQKINQSNEVKDVNNSR
jgi:hypothetical protein